MGDEPELRELRYFVAVAEELSFMRAAARLHLSQQSLSQAIAALERRVGAALLARTTRSVTLTGPGAVMLVEARAVLAAADDAMTRVQAAVGRLQGRLRLGCSFDLHHVLTPVLHTIRAHQPDLDVEIGLGTQQALLIDLAAQRIDAALTWRRPAGTTGVCGVRVLVAPLLAVVRDDDPLTRLHPPLTRRQLRMRPLIIHHRRAAPGPYDEMIEQFYEGADAGPLEHIDVLASGHGARLHALRAGRGVALMAEFAHRALDTSGTTVVSVHPPLQVTVELLWPERAGSRAPAQRSSTWRPCCRGPACCPRPPLLLSRCGAAQAVTRWSWRRYRAEVDGDAVVGRRCAVLPLTLQVRATAARERPAASSNRPAVAVGLRRAVRMS